MDLSLPTLKSSLSDSLSTVKINLKIILKKNNDLLKNNILKLNNYIKIDELKNKFNYNEFNKKMIIIEDKENEKFICLKRYCDFSNEKPIMDLISYFINTYNINFENSLNDIAKTFNYKKIKEEILNNIHDSLLDMENNNKIYLLDKMKIVLSEITNNSVGLVRLTTIDDLEKNIDKRVDEAIVIIKNVIDNLFKPFLFHVSMRYYEGVFVDEIQNIKKASTLLNPTERGIKNKYNLLSCIFPVFVSTMHSLSNKIKYREESDYYSNIGFIDILLVDEAGQVSTETGAISLLLSKKALIVGDIDQIPPVYSINEKIDNDITSYVFENKMKNEVWNTHSSSLMRVAQHNTPWHQYKNLSKGLYLLEHNRCPIELISFCDELKYNNTLLYDISSYYVNSEGEPKYNIEKYNSIMSIDKIKNKKITPNDLILKDQTPWKLITNNGNSKDSNNRINIDEINSILNWIDENYVDIKSSHSLNNKNEIFQLSKYIAIITPFKKQATNIVYMGKKYNFKNKDLLNDKEHLFSFNLTSPDIIPLTIGTVHSLQGAEKSVVLFSNVYGDKEEVSVPFIDRDESIINVAVSRAKQSFYVFANEKFLEKFKESEGATGKLYHFIKKYGQ